MTRSVVFKCLLAWLLPAIAGAQETVELRGTVTDTAGRVVPGAMVRFSDTRFGSVVDSAGRYRVRAAPGTYTVRVSRIGFSADSATVTIAAGVATRDFRLSPAAAMLGGVMVTAQRLGESKAAALERQASAPNLVTVLSGDEIRALPNLNAAEAAGRIPGVTTERDEGEGKFVQIRGTEPRLSNVTINGAHVPGTLAGQRVVKLDDVPSDILGAIEVSKTLTAEMDADAIGGSVNLVTKTPEGAPQGYISGQFGQMSLLNRDQYQGGFTYGGRYGEGHRLGLLIGGSADHNNRSIDDLEPAWGVDNAGRSFPNDWSQRSYVYGRNRYGVGADIDYRFDNGATLFLKGLFSRFENFGTTYVDDVASGSSNSTFGSTGDSAAVGTRGYATGVQVTREAYVRTPVEQLYGFTAGGSKALGNVTMKVTANFAGTSQAEHDYRFHPFTYSGPGGQGLTVAYDASNPKIPKFNYVNASMTTAAADPSNFMLSNFFTIDGQTTGHDGGGAIDFTAPWHTSDASWTSTLRFGAKLRDESKDFLSNAGSWSTNAPFSMAQAGAPFMDPRYYLDLSPGFAMGPSPNAVGAKAYEVAHMSQFTDGTNTVRNALATFSGSEKIYAGYVSNTIDAGALQLYLGLRAEAAQVAYTGHVVKKDTTGAVVGLTTVPGSSTNTDLFPSVQLKYQIDAATDWRLAVTRGIARPNYSQLAPSLQGTLDGSKSNSGNLSSGNPNLKAQHAWNYDFLIEHFFPSVGVVSAGVFYKDISDFIFNKTFIYSGPVTEFVGQAGTRPENGGSGHLLGFEMQYTQRFVALPGAFAGFGVDVNWTHVDSRVLVDPASGREAPMARTSPNLANAAITYDFGPVSARAAWAYQGANIASYGDGTPTANGDNYFYAHSQIDASVLYNISSRIQLQLQALNLNNAVFGFFNGTPSHDFSIQREYYERTIYMGLKYGF